MENKFYIGTKFESVVMSAQQPAALLQIMAIALDTLHDEQANEYSMYFNSARYAAEELKKTANNLEDKEGECVPFSHVWKFGSALAKLEQELHETCEAFGSEKEDDSLAYQLLVPSVFAVFDLVFQCQRDLEKLIEHPEQSDKQAA